MEESCIVLDVGGRLFKTKLKTLISVSGSYFNQLFADITNYDHLLNADGHLFIDRDGEIFHIVLGYLRHGNVYPLPDDDYKLNLIIFEAKFYKLPELAEAAEKARFYAHLNFAPPKPTTNANNAIVNSSFQRSRKVEPKVNEIGPLLSIPAIAPPLPPKPIVSENSSNGNNSNNNNHNINNNNNNGGALITRLSKKLSKKHCKEEIGMPKEFKHIVHIGWGDDGRRIVIDRSNNDQKTLKAIVQAIYEETSTQPLLYSVVDADEDENHSESVEIFFTGSSIRAVRDNNPPAVALNSQTGIYDNCSYEVSRSNKKAKLYTKPLKTSPIVTDM